MAFPRTTRRRYCEFCDVWVSPRRYTCPDCGGDTVRAVPESPEAEAAVDPREESTTGTPPPRDAS